MVGFGRDLWRSSSPAPLLKQVPLEQAAQDHIQVGFEISGEGQSTTSLGSLFQCSVRVKKFFLMFIWNFLCCSLCPLPLVLSLAPLKRVWPHPPDTHPEDIYQPSVLQAKQAQLPQLFLVGETLQTPHHPRSPPLVPLPGLGFLRACLGTEDWSKEGIQ